MLAGSGKKEKHVKKGPDDDDGKLPRALANRTWLSVWHETDLAVTTREAMESVLPAPWQQRTTPLGLLFLPMTVTNQLALVGRYL